MSTLAGSIKKLHTILLTYDNKGTMVEAKIEWLLNIIIAPPYGMTGKGHRLPKISKSGIILGAYMPSERKSVLVAPLPENPGHMLLSHPSLKNVSLNLVTEFSDIKQNLNDIPDLSTLIIEVVFGDAPEDAFKILPGLLIKWLKKHEC